jgi:hypothetical protein
LFSSSPPPILAFPLLLHSLYPSQVCLQVVEELDTMFVWPL